jgi:hypothetical protein
MARLKLYYGGWMALPAALCQKLRLETGSELEAELVHETIVLRPIIRRAPAKPKSAPKPGSATPPSAPRKAAPVVRDLRQPRADPFSALSPTLKSRSRRKGSAAAPPPQPERPAP